jgi:5-methylcytosine-specific restriction endonuclease McrA
LVKSRVSIARAIAEAEAQIAEMRGSQEVSGDSDRQDDVRASPELVTTVSRQEAYRERAKLTKRLRWKILERDNFRCTICGADGAADRNVRLDVDHTIPVNRGGKTEVSNLRTLCNRCNNGKGDLLP